MKVSELIDILIDVQSELGDLDVVLISNDDNDELVLDEQIYLEFFGESEDKIEAVGLTNFYISEEDPEDLQ